MNPLPVPEFWFYTSCMYACCSLSVSLGHPIVIACSSNNSLLWEEVGWTGGRGSGRNRDASNSIRHLQTCFSNCIGRILRGEGDCESWHTCVNVHSTCMSSFHENLLRPCSLTTTTPRAARKAPFLEPLVQAMLTLPILLGKGASSCTRNLNKNWPGLPFVLLNKGMAGQLDENEGSFYQAPLSISRVQAWSYIKWRRKLLMVQLYAEPVWGLDYAGATGMCVWTESLKAMRACSGFTPIISSVDEVHVYKPIMKD